jgi:predicted esterase
MRQPVPTSSKLGFEHVLVPGRGRTTLLLLHGTGGDEHQLVELGQQLAPDASLLSPRGKVLEGTMPRFFRRHAPGQLDIPDLLARTDELGEFLAAATTEYGLDPARVVAVGYSNGANIAASLLLRRARMLRGAVLLRAMLPYDPGEAPALAGTSVLVAAGARDPYVPLEQSERLAEVLRAGGAEVELRVADAGHELTRSELAAAASWLASLEEGE